MKTSDFFLSLMIENTPCFGFFEKSDPICLSCPLTQPCQRDGVPKRLESIAYEVQRKRFDHLKAEEEKAYQIKKAEKEKANQIKYEKCLKLAPLMYPTTTTNSLGLGVKAQELTSRFSEEEIDQRLIEYQNQQVASLEQIRDPLKIDIWKDVKVRPKFISEEDDTDRIIDEVLLGD